jgi:hypothetical protein
LQLQPNVAAGLSLEAKELITSVDLSHINLDGQKLTLMNRGARCVYLRSNRDKIFLRDFEVDLVGLNFDQVIFHFPYATELVIHNTANPSYGIPGFVFAPYADTRFMEGLISGALWVHEIFYNDSLAGPHSGQINGIGEPPQPLN